jgi:hypothetical protein
MNPLSQRTTPSLAPGAPQPPCPSGATAKDKTPQPHDQRGLPTKPGTPHLPTRDRRGLPTEPGVPPISQPSTFNPPTAHHPFSTFKRLDLQTACPERSEGFKRLQLPIFNLSAAAQPSTFSQPSSIKNPKPTIPSPFVPRKKMNSNNEKRMFTFPSPVDLLPLYFTRSEFVTFVVCKK